MPTCRQHQLLARTAHMHKSSTSLWKIRWTTIQIRHCQSNSTLSKQQIKTKSPPQKFIFKHLTTDNRHFTSLHCSKLGETKLGPTWGPKIKAPVPPTGCESHGGWEERSFPIDAGGEFSPLLASTHGPLSTRIFSPSFSRPFQLLNQYSVSVSCSKTENICTAAILSSGPGLPPNFSLEIIGLGKLPLIKENSFLTRKISYVGVLDFKNPYL